MDDRPDLLRRAAAEGFGVFALVFAGCGAIVTEAEHPGTLGVVGIAFVFGLIVMAMVYATGHLSGAHLNPAVTLAFALTRHFPRAEAVAYLARPARRRPRRGRPARRRLARASRPRWGRPCRRSASAAPSSTRWC